MVHNEEIDHHGRLCWRGTCCDLQSYGLPVNPISGRETRVILFLLKIFPNVDQYKISFEVLLSIRIRSRLNIRHNHCHNQGVIVGMDHPYASSTVKEMVTGSFPVDFDGLSTACTSLECNFRAWALLAELDSPPPANPTIKIMVWISLSTPPCVCLSDFLLCCPICRFPDRLLDHFADRSSGRLFLYFSDSDSGNPMIAISSIVVSARRVLLLSLFWDKPGQLAILDQSFYLHAKCDAFLNVMTVVFVKVSVLVHVPWVSRCPHFSWSLESRIIPNV